MELDGDIIKIRGSTDLRKEGLYRTGLGTVKQFRVYTPMNWLNFPGGSDGKASVYNVGDNIRSLGQEDPLEKEMAIHSSIIAWKTPWTEEPGRLQSMGSKRVGHDMTEHSRE